MTKKPDNDAADRVRAIIREAHQQAMAVGGAGPDPSPSVRAEPETPSLTAEELLEECSREPETDIGNARRFMIRHGQKVVHVARIGWHGFDGRRWKEDEDGSLVRPLAQNAAEWIHDEAILLDARPEEAQAIDAGRVARDEQKAMGKQTREWTAEETGKFEKLQGQIERMDAAQKAIAGRMSARFRHAKSSAGTTKINNILTEAAPHVALTIQELNTDLYAFNVKNGTLRFHREENPDSDPDDPTYTWVVRLDRHDPKDRISKLASVEWLPGASIRTFDRFLKTVLPDPEIRRFIQRYAGYCLLGDTSEQCLLFFYGAGRNGKSTLVELLCDILGDYAVSLSIDSLAGDTRRGGNEATPDLARLPGARLVSASEPDMGVRLKEALIKHMTGGEKMTVRRLHQDFVEFIPQFHLILQGNHKPRIDDNSDGIWRRFFVVPFEVQIPRDQVDRALPEKLRAERAGVFAWMVAGALEYLNHGLMPPEKVLLATEEYREESDPIGAFIRTACQVTGREEDMASPEDLFIGYSNYAAKEGTAEFRRVTFSRRFPDYARRSWDDGHGQMKQFWKAKSGTTVYRGIRVKDEFVMPKGGQDDFEGRAR